ncbi:hypothetical protein KKC13_05380 [bacterium]|nr:hypothetical protein [bacterium]MBU1958467.1 hypothetical protein [bacterium]
MSIKKLLLLLLLITSIYAEDNTSVWDQYHDTLCMALINTSNSIDNYFIEENSSDSSTTSAQFSTSFAMENNQDLEKDIRLRLRLNLPKIQKNLRLVFEDENNDNALYDGTTLNDERLENKRYYLRLEYFNFMKYKLNMVAGGGVRIRQNTLVPYFNLRSQYNAYQDDTLKSEFYNRFRFYSDGEIENIFEFNALYHINTSLFAVWRNQLRFDTEEEFETLTSDLSLIKSLEEKTQVSVGLGIINQLTNLKNPNIEYYHLHTLYHHVFYKDWLYYQLAPSVLWRESNDFEISYRFMVNFGVLFNRNY